MSRFPLPDGIACSMTCTDHCWNHPAPFYGYTMLSIRFETCAMRMLFFPLTFCQDSRFVRLRWPTEFVSSQRSAARISRGWVAGGRCARPVSAGVRLPTCSGSRRIPEQQAIWRFGIGSIFLFCSAVCCLFPPSPNNRRSPDCTLHGSCRGVTVLLVSSVSAPTLCRLCVYPIVKCDR